MVLTTISTKTNRDHVITVRCILATVVAFPIMSLPGFAPYLRQLPERRDRGAQRLRAQGDMCSAANFVPEPKSGLSAVYLENDFSPLMRSAGEHLVSGAHIVQRQKGAYLRAQLSTAKQPRNSVQPFRTDFSVEKY